MIDQAQAAEVEVTITKTAGFDIDSLPAEAGQITYDVPLIFNADGDAISGYRVVGKNSPEYQTEFEAVRVEGIMKAGRRKVALDTSTPEGAATLARMIKGQETRIALAVVVGWFGFQKGGVDAPFDKEVVRATFKKYPTWRTKVSDALENDGNFIKG